LSKIRSAIPCRSAGSWWRPTGRADPKPAGCVVTGFREDVNSGEGWSPASPIPISAPSEWRSGACGLSWLNVTVLGMPSRTRISARLSQSVGCFIGLPRCRRSAARLKAGQCRRPGSGFYGEDRVGTVMINADASLVLNIGQDLLAGLGRSVNISRMLVIGPSR
jgi:hypothetical protein